METQTSSNEMPPLVLNPQKRVPLLKTQTHHPHPEPTIPISNSKSHPTAPTPDSPDQGSIFFIGTATTLITWRGIRILTDPNFLHAGDRTYTPCSPRSTYP